MLRRLFNRWEQSIFDHHASDRRPQPFDWGLDNLADLVGETNNGADLAALADALCERSEDFYRAGAVSGADFDGFRLSYDSPLPSGDEEVRRASARLFKSSRDNGRAVIVVPQWNADETSMIQACKILAGCGLTALRLTLPYHEDRRPERMIRSDAMVSPVLGLTLQSVRRAVIEVRLAADWLHQQGYGHIGVFGTSLGSCIGFLALAHDERIQAAAFNHVAGYFADVVWAGLATRHVRTSLDGYVDLETLRRCWAPISPARFASRLAARQPKMLFVSGAYDPIFLPAHSQQLVDALLLAGVPFRRVVMPCGHYTLGKPPFVVVDAFLIVRFLQRHLRSHEDR